MSKGITKEQRKQIDCIMDNFKFKRVARAMKALKWTWISVCGVPTESEIRGHARELMEDTITSDSGYRATGGLVCEFKEGYLHLHFQVDSWGADKDGVSA